VSTAGDEAVARYRLPNRSGVPVGYLTLVRELALRARPVNAREGQVNCRAVLALAAARLAQGLPVTREALLNPDSLSRHLTELSGAVGGQAFKLHANALNRIARAYGQPQLGRDEGYAPYRRDDVDRLYEWADRVRDARDRHGVLAVLTFGLGAGLGRPDLLRLVGTHVNTNPHDGTVTVAAGPNRVVPLLRPYERLAAELAADAGTGWALQPATARATGTVIAYRDMLLRARPDPRLPILTARRCRNTWIDTHLAGGTPIAALLRAADLTLRDLDRHVVHLALLPDEDRDRELLRPR